MTIGITSLIVSGASIALGACASFYGGLQAIDARRFRKIDEQRRADEAEASRQAAEAARVRAERLARYELSIRDALRFLDQLEEIPTRITGGLEALSPKTMNRLHLPDRSRQAQNIAGRLPDRSLFGREEHGIAYLIDQLAARAFEPSGFPRDENTLAKSAMSQLLAAQALEHAIVTARERLRDELV